MGLSIEWTQGIARYGKDHTDFREKSPYDLIFTVIVLHGCAYFKGGKADSSGAALDMTAWMDFKNFFEKEENRHIEAMQWERVRKDGSLQCFRWKKDPSSKRGWKRDTCGGLTYDGTRTDIPKLAVCKMSQSE